MLGPQGAFMDILGSTYKKDQIPVDPYGKLNFPIALEKEFTVHKIWVNELKIREISSKLTAKDIASNEFFYVAANSDIAYILAPLNLQNISPILQKAKGM